MMRIAIGLMISIMFNSCSVFDGNENNEVRLKRSWEVQQFFNASGNQIELNEDEPLTLRFLSKKNLGGNADCNIFGGEYKAKEDGELKINNLVTTEIACEEPTLGYQYLDALSEVKTFRLKEGKLILNYNKEGKLIFLDRLE